jgi:hypothetical protein
MSENKKRDEDDFNPEEALRELREATEALPAVPPRRSRSIMDLPEPDFNSAIEITESLQSFFSTIESSDFGTSNYLTSRPAIIDSEAIPLFENEQSTYSVTVPDHRRTMSIGELTAYILDANNTIPTTQVVVQAMPSLPIVHRIVTAAAEFTRSELVNGHFLISFNEYINILRANQELRKAEHGVLYIRAHTTGYDICVKPGLVQDGTNVFYPDISDLPRIIARRERPW